MPLSDTLRAWARAIKRDGVTLWFAYRHAGTPRIARLLCMLVVAYALSPIDLIPDFIPVLGYLDDVILLPCLIWLVIKLIPEGVLSECRTRANDWMATHDGKPRSNWGYLLVALVWMFATWALWTYLVSPWMHSGAPA